MFNNLQLFAHNARLRHIWRAATLRPKFSREELSELNISEICEEILNPHNFAVLPLRLKATLLGGLAIVHKQKVKLFYSDLLSSLKAVNAALPSRRSERIRARANPVITECVAEQPPHLPDDSSSGRTLNIQPPEPSPSPTEGNIFSNSLENLQQVILDRIQLQMMSVMMLVLLKKQMILDRIQLQMMSVMMLVLLKKQVILDRIQLQMMSVMMLVLLKKQMMLDRIQLQMMSVMMLVLLKLDRIQLQMMSVMMLVLLKKQMKLDRIQLQMMSDRIQLQMMSVMMLVLLKKQMKLDRIQLQMMSVMMLVLLKKQMILVSLLFYMIHVWILSHRTILLWKSHFHPNAVRE
ncbi:PREDICTED: uncharacterized protein LOC109168692 [Ipomoea nil]|uniref:uncharacterized protein LOC109168692 n=1 Tax=Ipomoea nil TaxID=35883 RepID=UPI0009011046|nr:PREDICTED: uncharacterized protein LOC109168692 [Ipomoea nil]